MKVSVKGALAAATLGLTVQAASAHEFWIEPHSYQVVPNAPLVADILVGQKFQGVAFTYIPQNFSRFDVRLGNRVVPVESRPGDRPALKQVVPGEGLAVIVHVTRNYRLNYDGFEKFEQFVRHKDAAWAVKAHRDRALPEDRFREQYVRFAKSLVAIGSGAGQDREEGLVTEIVALENPYTGDTSDGLDVRVLYDGNPRSFAQVELFDRSPDGTVDITLHRTDAAGEVTLPAQAGHVYLVDAVVLRPLDPVSPTDPVWESLWASLTFEVPQ